VEHPHRDRRFRSNCARGPVVVVTVRRSSNGFIVCLTCAVLTMACGDSSPTSPSASLPTTFLSLVSSPGDRIGDGFTQRVGLSDALFSARVSTLSGDRQSIDIGVSPIGGVSVGWWWNMRFAMPPGEPLRTGTFDGARRWPGQGTQPGMDFSGSGRGCSALSGRFVITELVPGQSSTPDRLHITFEQLCDGATAPIRGEISIAANPWR
jgi:hypothetical protein